MARDRQRYKTHNWTDYDPVHKRYLDLGKSDFSFIKFSSHLLTAFLFVISITVYLLVSEDLSFPN